MEPPVGIGSGYHAAVLSRLCVHVFSIERHPVLSRRAARALRAAGIANVSLEIGDGCHGWPEHAPYDAINVGATAWGEVPPALAAQLARGGRLVAPVRAAPRHAGERLVLLRRDARGRLHATRLDRVRFVPLVGGA